MADTYRKSEEYNFSEMNEYERNFIDKYQKQKEEEKRKARIRRSK